MVSSDLPDCTGSVLHIFHGGEDCFPPPLPAALMVLYQLYVSIVIPAQLLSSIKGCTFWHVDDLWLFRLLILFLGERSANVAMQGICFPTCKMKSEDSIFPTTTWPLKNRLSALFSFLFLVLCIILNIG